MNDLGLHVDGLSVSLAGSNSTVAALTDVSFEVLPGEVVGLVGESGAGKSMIAHAIANQLPSSANVSGSIRIDGQDLLPPRSKLDGGSKRVRAALCFQNPRLALSPTRTIGKQIADRLRNHQKSNMMEISEGVLELLGRVGIRDPEVRSKSFPHELSGGMCQRIMIALALACESSVLLADEPSTGLDVTLTGEILRLFRGMADSDKQAVLIISHDIAAIAAVCDRLMVLYAGSLVEVGLSNELLRAPAHPYTRALIDAVPDVDREAFRSPPLPGRMPQLSAAPVSCPFVPRCVFSDQKCRSEMPTMTFQSESWKVRCFHSEKQVSAISDRNLTNASSQSSGNQTSYQVDGNKPMIRLEGVHVAYRLRSGLPARAVLKDINLTFNRGDTVGFVGESGCGKSTLARAIMGLIRPTQGEVWFGDVNLNKQSRSELRHLRRHMQLVFQDALDSLNPRLRVDEIITDPLRLIDSTREEKNSTVDQILDQVSLDRSFKTRLPRELSGGQAQRIGIARGLVIDPDLIIFDEPTSALDATIQAQVLVLIQSLMKRRDRTYLFISHDLSTVRGLCDRVVVMYLGRVVEDGPVDRVFEDPRHPYTRALLAAIPRLNAPPSGDTVKLKRDLEDDIGGDGCNLLSRCPFSESRCATEQDFLKIAEGHRVACWKAAGETSSVPDRKRFDG